MVFQVSNRSKTPIRIVDVSTSCGCTDATIERSVPPGEVVRGSAIFHAENVGDRYARITIRWKFHGLESTYVTTIDIRGHVTQLIRCEPEQLDLARNQVGYPQFGKIHVFRGSERGISWNALAVEAESQAAVEVSQISSDEWVVSYSRRGERGRLGSWSDTIRLSVQNDGQVVDERWINVSGAIDGPFDVEPKSFYFGSIPLGEEVSKTAVISSRFGHPEIHSVTARPSGESIKVLEGVAKNSGATIPFLVRPKKAGAFSETIRIEVEGDESYVFDFPVLGFVKAMSTAQKGSGAKKAGESE